MFCLNVFSNKSVALILVVGLVLLGRVAAVVAEIMLCLAFQIFKSKISCLNSEKNS